MIISGIWRRLTSLSGWQSTAGVLKFLNVRSNGQIAPLWHDMVATNSVVLPETSAKDADAVRCRILVWLSDDRETPMKVKRSVDRVDQVS